MCPIWRYRHLGLLKSKNGEGVGEEDGRWEEEEEEEEEE